jgi:hypothetical protein
MNGQQYPEIEGNRQKVSMLDSHEYVCTLIDVEIPILSLYRDQKHNWFYLWCDTNNVDTNRWLVFDVSREQFALYLNKKISLRTVISESSKLLCLDVVIKEEKTKKGDTRKNRILLEVNVEQIQNYLPAEDSIFDSDYSPDISLEQELMPSKFKVEIGGEWYLGELDKFTKIYHGLYGFLYCVKPRFVTNLGAVLERTLHAPWEGGFSRLNLFDRLVKSIPSFHDTRITRMEYASPGGLTFEALASVDQDIKKIAKKYVLNRTNLLNGIKKVNMFLSKNKLRKENLSKKKDEDIDLIFGEWSTFKKNLLEIVQHLDIENEFENVKKYSPNSIVSSKVLLALVSQISRLVEYEDTGMLNITGAGKRKSEFSQSYNWLENYDTKQ